MLLVLLLALNDPMYIARVIAGGNQALSHPHPTPHTPPSTLHPPPSTLHPTPYTLHPPPDTLGGNQALYAASVLSPSP